MLIYFLFIYFIEAHICIWAIGHMAEECNMCSDTAMFIELCVVQDA